MSHSIENFKNAILTGIPNNLPSAKPYIPNANHAPKRKDILTSKEKKLAVKNALRYFLLPGLHLKTAA